MDPTLESGKATEKGKDERSKRIPQLRSMRKERGLITVSPRVIGSHIETNGGSSQSRSLGPVQGVTTHADSL